MSYKIIGTCSNCKGAVTIPLNWLGIHPPVPRCSSCNRTPKSPYGDVIEMSEEQNNKFKILNEISK